MRIGMHNQSNLLQDWYLEACDINIGLQTSHAVQFWWHSITDFV